MANVNLILDFPMEFQEETNWCWAATAVSVAFFYSQQQRWTQCQLASAELGQSCCENRGPCNEPWYLDSALSRTGNFDRLQEGVITWQGIRNEMASGRVLCAFIRWHGNSEIGHFVAISGVERIGSNKKVCIDDPIYGEKIMKYSRFRDNYRDLGSWTWTYFTK